MEITSSGYQVESYADILQEITDDIKAVIPEFNENDSNVIVNMNKIMANMIHKLSLAGLDLYNSRAVDGASGVTLDKILSNFSITRNGAMPSTGTVTFSGTDGTAIPSGFRVSTTDNRVYYTTNNGTITNGTLDLEIASVLTGDDTTASSSIVTTIVNPLSGVDSVTNNEAITGGSDIESDVELRARYYLLILGLGKSTYAAVNAAILDNALASKVNIIENGTDTVDSLGIPAHSFRAVVLGGEQDDILEQIYDTRPLGIIPDGDITKTFESKYISAFSRPTVNEIGFSVDITSNSSVTLTNAIELISNDIEEAISSLAIGGTISHSLFLAAMYKSTGSYIAGFSNFYFWIDEADKKGLGEEITQTGLEVATITDSDITIVVD